MKGYGFMDKHLIIIDLDGTLLNSQSKISTKNKDVIKKLSKKGHMIVLATGRPFHAAIDYYNELELDTPVITDNGGNIREPKNPDFQIVTDGIPVKISHQLFNFSKPHLESAFYSFGDHIYAYQYLNRLHAIFMGSQNAKIIHADFDELHHTPTGMIYLVSYAFKQQFESYLTNELGNDVQFRLWGEDFKHSIYEISKKNSSKLSAIKWVYNHFQIKEENVIAFGDGLNDVEMIGGVHLGLAMPNGVAEVKAVAKAILPHDNDHSGVGKFLEKHFNLTT